MASSKIKGITIEINGNTTKLQDALKNVDKQVYGLNSDLKALNQALKLDPKNTELLAQKQDVLGRNIAATAERLETLKEAQRQMGSYAKLTDAQKESYNQLSVEITKAEHALNSMNEEVKSMDRMDLSKLKEGLSQAGKVAAGVAATVAAAVAAAAAAIGKLMKDAINSYAAYEQNVGGVETLFKENADIVIKNAKNAYRTAGVSANQYMQTVTSFSASLLQSTGKDTKKAAQIADMAFIDMADNANKFGTSMESIQNAYQGFAKQNYNMLDNLKLGYGGSRKEMERLLSDAQKLTGVKYNINNLADVYNAIHAIQESLDVTGTTAKEAESTITGSAASMKAAFDNFLNGSGGVEKLSKTLSTFLKNILAAVKKLAPGLVRGIVDLFKTLVPELANMVGELLPIVIDGAKQLIQGLINFINNDSEQFINMAVDMLMNLVTFILDNLPILLQASIKMIAELARGLAKAAPDLIPAIVDCLVLMVDTIIDNLDLLIDAALELILALTEGIFKALPRLIERLPELVEKLVKALIKAAPKMLDAAVELIGQLAQGLLDGIGSIFDVGWKLIEGLVDGIKKGWEWLKGTVKGIGEGIVDFFKGIFGIHSPSKIMREEIGKNLGLGIVEGINDTVSDVEKAMSNLSSGVEASVNPTINPTANSNPLYVMIDKFINDRETSVQQLAEELEFYRKMTATAKGGA